MIQINNSRLNDINKEYCVELNLLFNSRMQNIFEVLALLKKSTQVNKCDVKGNVKAYKTILIAVLGIPKLSDSKIKNEKDREDLIFTFNKFRVSSDKRSKCRKTLLYNDVEIQVKKIDKFIRKHNLFGAIPNDLVKLDCILKRYLVKYNKKVYAYLFDYSCKKYYNLINNKLGKLLDLKCCPYCNRNYITYIDNEYTREIGPSYDHFFNKEKYKFLTLSFYNLIPSCYICNSNLKSNKDFKLKSHINPYLEGFENDCTFDFDLMTKDYFGSRKISFKPKLIFSQFIDSEKKIKITGNITVFKLNQIYETHEDSIEEIYKRFDISSPFYIGSISKILKELKTSEEEFYRYYFRNYYQSIDFNKRPLAKLDRDIYEKFKLISSSN